MNDWPRVPLKHLVDINQRVLPETTPASTEFRYIDISTCGRGRLEAEPELMRFADAPSRARRLVRSGDTLVATVRTYLRAVWPAAGSPDDLVASTGFAVLSPRDRLDPGFLGWVAQSDPFIEEIVARSVGVSYPAVNGLEVGELSVGVPQMATQRAIADYLDAETARIDALVAARRLQTELVAERFRALREARVRALLEEFGTVPLKRLACRIEQGWSPDAEAVPAEPREWGVLKTSAVSAGKFDGSQNKRLPAGVTFDRRWAVMDGDLLVVRGSGSPGAVAQAAVAATGGRHLLLPDLLYRVRLRVGDARFLAHALASQFARDQFEAAIRTDVGMTRKIRSEDLANVLVPAAPVPIQQQASDALDQETTAIERVREAARRQIDLLLERRQALITAAVTGQLEIPGVAA